ncbi:MAG TPA: aspartyl protease family protein [Pyrinomonadaceae bacterium]|nr:aspartyl protease family protein [Pyrinomonadaceae bacterium]
MSPRVLIVIVALVFTSLLPTAASRVNPTDRLAAVQSSAKAEKTKGPVEIPFELANRHIMLKVKVDGSRPLSFVLDTGDKYAILDLERAKELGLKLHGQIRVGGAGTGTQTGSFVEGSNFTIPGFEGFIQPIRMALPIGSMAQGLGQAFDGIIGYDFIKEFVVEVDYQARVIKLHDKDKFTYSGPGESIPISLEMPGHGSGHPILEAEVTPIGGAPTKGKYVLDIGSGMALALHSPFVAEHGLLAPERKTIKAFGAGAGGEINARLGRVSELKIGKFKISNPVTLFSEDTAGAFANRALAGNIGAQIASKFRIFLDYGRSRIIFEPNSTFGEPFERSSAGVRVYAEGPDFRVFRVKNVLEDSPGSEAGLKRDDIITDIDGKPAAEFTLTKLNEMFERPVSYKVTVKRGEQTLKVTLTPRKLV